MATWHDLVTAAPADDAQFVARRLPEDTVPATAVWTPGHATLLMGPAQWPIPWPFVTRYTLVPAGSKPVPPVPSGALLPVGTWRDVLAVPPAAEQLCWVRRWPEDTHTFQATWVAAPGLYFLLASGAQLPWYLAWKWRPVS